MVKNRRLSKGIHDAAWYELVRQVKYKAQWAGKHFVQIEKGFASSKTCSCCRHKLDELPLSIREWNCPSCGTHHDRDRNAALNVQFKGISALKAEGLSVSACGDLRKTSWSKDQLAAVDEARSLFL